MSEVAAVLQDITNTEEQQAIQPRHVPPAAEAVPRTWAGSGLSIVTSNLKRAWDILSLSNGSARLLPPPQPVAITPATTVPVAVTVPAAAAVLPATPAVLPAVTVPAAAVPVITAAAPPAAVPLTATTPAIAAAVPSAPALLAISPVLLDAPVSAKVYDAASSILHSLNPFAEPASTVVITVDQSELDLDRIVNQVVSDFGDNGIQVNRKGIRDVIANALPTAQVRSAACRFLTNSWSASHFDVNRAYKTMDALDKTYGGVPEGILSFYVRTKALHVSDIILLRHHFEHRFHHPEFLAKLEGLIAAAGNGAVYLRYIGQTAGPSNPAKRYREDILFSASLFAKVNMLLEDMRANYELSNESAWTVHEFTSLRCTALGSSDFCTNYIERILIAIFGWDNLINVQRGGYYGDYDPSEADLQVFQQLNTRVYAHLAELNVSPGIGSFTGRPTPIHPRQDQIIAHNEAVFEFIRANPYLINNRVIKETLRIVVDTLQQATPITRNLCGGTLVLCVGKDLPLETLDTSAKDVRFFFGEARSSHLARLMVNQLADAETHKPDTLGTILDLFPFIDLYPWVLRDQLARGSTFLQNYMRIVRPWITVTFSGIVTNTVARGFAFYGSFEGQSEAGRTHGELVDVIGKPFPASFDSSWTEDSSASGPADSAFTVGIAHYDPGRNKYGLQPLEMRRLMWLTWVVTFILIDEAHGILTGYEGRQPTQPFRTRRQLCEVIRSAAQKRLDTTGITQTMDTERAALKLILNAKRKSAGPSSSVLCTAKAIRRVKHAVERAAVVAKQFPAVGAPKSPERQRQADLLYARQLLPLGRHLPYNGDPGKKQQWMDWVLSRREGVSLIHSALMHACTAPSWDRSDQDKLKRILALSDEDLVADPGRIQTALAERLESMQLGRIGSVRVKQVAQSRAMLRWNVIGSTIGHLDGKQANVMSRKMAWFYTQFNGDLKAFRFNISQEVVDATQNPVQCFRDDGIHLEHPETGANLFTVRADRMVYMGTQGIKLQQVWQRELWAVQGSSAAEPAIPPAPAAGRLPPKYAARSKDGQKKFMQIAPIAEEDAIWVFKQWLDEEFASDINIADTHWRDPANRFLKLPGWIQANFPNHPHRPTWEQIVADGAKLNSPSIFIFRGCILALRGEFLGEQKYTVPGTKYPKISGKRWTFAGARDDSELTRRPGE
ncbi:hypothetical protein HDU86_005276 [Geranomyces michiganensis]|nr:hypothetical protein HDU86_005276 [Geranomyces michiganensis]